MPKPWRHWKQRGPRICDRDIADVEAQLGIALPEEYRSFMRVVNGGCPRLDHSFIGGRIIAELLSIEPSDLLGLLPSNQRVERPSDALLFIGVDDVNRWLYLVVDGERRGQVWGGNRASQPVSMDVEWFERSDMHMLARTFNGFLRALGQPDPRRMARFAPIHRIMVWFLKRSVSP